MAFRTKNEKSDGLVAPQAEAEIAATYLDQGCELSGSLRFKETVRIDGHIEGEIDCAKTVIVGEAAAVRARIECESVVIHGRVEGDVVAKRKITLHKTAQVSGDMKTAGIVIEEGANFKGRIVIGSDEKPAKAEKPAASAGAPPLAN